jgi:predicted RNA binding protein with dsRBD fold (UPF0201 family)
MLAHHSGFSFDALFDTVSVGSSLDTAALLRDVDRMVGLDNGPPPPAVLVIAGHPCVEDVVRKALALVWPDDDVDVVEAMCVSVGDIFDDLRMMFGSGVDSSSTESFCAAVLHRRILDTTRRCVLQELSRDLVVVIGVQSPAVLAQLPVGIQSRTVSMDHMLPLSVHAYINPQSTPRAVAHMLYPHIAALLLQ